LLIRKVWFLYETCFPCHLGVSLWEKNLFFPVSANYCKTLKYIKERKHLILDSVQRSYVHSKKKTWFFAEDLLNYLQELNINMNIYLFCKIVKYQILDTKQFTIWMSIIINGNVVDIIWLYPCSDIPCYCLENNFLNIEKNYFHNKLISWLVLWNTARK
jgi:hypothetical protein